MFDTNLTQAAYAVASHGFAELEAGSFDGPIGWHAVAYVDAVILDNIGEHELADERRDACRVLGRETGWWVWIRQYDDGRTMCRKWRWARPTDPLPDGWERDLQILESNGSIGIADPYY